ncbi:hypothetical protein NW762_013643 [Fusarium torreyae]|uniref:Berberine/berberine-like domain-containing protein n=1 Tax=Fusarium torreyae TaxID=1237075 RepID=A0A9W8RN55_9HYPO|nr:hypothetical protein NW762_013643 [Fusarium torreyae]
MKAAVMTFSITKSKTASYDAFWKALRPCWQLLPNFNDSENYAYWPVTHREGDTLAFSVAPWFAPNHTLAELKLLFHTWEELSIDFSITEAEHDSFYGAWAAGFLREDIGGAKTKTAGRLCPTHSTRLSDKGGQVIGFGITGGPGPYPDNAVNRAWHSAAMWAISVVDFPEGSLWDVISEKCKTLTNEWMKPWRDVTPGGSAAEKYERLLSIKDKVDPSGLFYAHQGVGSDRWYVTYQRDGVPTQHGRLCRI